MVLKYENVVMDKYGRVLVSNTNGELLEIVPEDTVMNRKTSFGFLLDTCDNSYCDDTNCRGNDWNCTVSNCSGSDSYCQERYC
jgi:hypothetical protein